MEPEKTPRERAIKFITIKFIKDLVAPAWQLSRDQVLWATRIVLVLAVLLAILTLIGLPFGITLWAWVKLLIVPVVLAIGGFLFTRSENRATQAAAERRAQDEALQAYLDQMSGMLISNKEQPSLYKAQLGDSLSSVARARTLTVLPRLDGERKARVVEFLYEAGLITKDRPVLALSETDLRGTNLTGANLSGANLRKADLDGASLLGTNLSGADLSETNLRAAVLVGDDLSRADLRVAHLSWADLSSANLEEAHLSGTRLSGANLTGAVVPEEQLKQAKSLVHATMPDGQTLRSDSYMPNGPTFEDWLKSEGREEDGGNGSTS